MSEFSPAQWRWHTMEAARRNSQDDEAQSDASLQIESALTETGLQLLFTLTALTPTGVSLNFILEGRWEGSRYGQWQPGDIENFIDRHAAEEGFAKINQALEFFADNFDTQVPIFSSAQV